MPGPTTPDRGMPAEPPGRTGRAPRPRGRRLRALAPALGTGSVGFRGRATGCAKRPKEPARRTKRSPYAALALLFLGAFAGCRGEAPGERTASGPQNLLLVTLDTVRADHLGSYGYAGAETPALDRLAGEGVRFAAASSPVPLTLPAHSSLLSGFLPPHHGLRNNGAGSFPADLPTLATRLAAAGYRTGAFVGSFVLDHRFGLARGFEVYDDEMERDAAGGRGLDAERRGDQVVDRALAWLQTASAREKPETGRAAVLPLGPPLRRPRPLHPARALRRPASREALRRGDRLRRRPGRPAPRRARPSAPRGGHGGGGGGRPRRGARRARRADPRPPPLRADPPRAAPPPRPRAAGRESHRHPGLARRPGARPSPGSSASRSASRRTPAKPAPRPAPRRARSLGRPKARRGAAGRRSLCRDPLPGDLRLEPARCSPPPRLEVHLGATAGALRPRARSAGGGQSGGAAGPGGPAPGADPGFRRAPGERRPLRSPHRRSSGARRRVPRPAGEPGVCGRCGRR